MLHYILKLCIAVDLRFQKLAAIDQQPIRIRYLIRRVPRAGCVEIQTQEQKVGVMCFLGLFQDFFWITSFQVSVQSFILGLVSELNKKTTVNPKTDGGRGVEVDLSTLWFFKKHTF